MMMMMIMMMITMMDFFDGGIKVETSLDSLNMNHPMEMLVRVMIIMIMMIVMTIIMVMTMMTIIMVMTMMTIIMVMTMMTIEGNFQDRPEGRNGHLTSPSTHLVIIFVINHHEDNYTNGDDDE